MIITVLCADELRCRTFIFHAHVVLKSLILLFVHLILLFVHLIPLCCPVLFQARPIDSLNCTSIDSMKTMLCCSVLFQACSIGALHCTSYICDIMFIAAHTSSTCQSQSVSQPASLPASQSCFCCVISFSSSQLPFLGVCAFADGIILQ